MGSLKIFQSIRSSRLASHSFNIFINKYMSEELYYKDYILAWKPSFNLELNSFHFEFLNQAKNIPVVLPSFQIKILTKLFMGFMRYDQTNKQRLLSTRISCLIEILHVSKM